MDESHQPWIRAISTQQEPSAVNKSPITFISRAAPYGSARARNCLDMALAAAVFEQPVNYIFLGDGVYQLLQGQQGDAIGSKTIGKTLAALELYGIEKVHVCQQSLRQRHLKPDDLIIPVIPASPEDIQGLMAESACVFNL